MPPAFRNHLVPTACGTPAPTAASSLAMPAAIAAQNRRRSSRPATGGRPGDDNGARPDRSERRFRMFIATSFVKVLRRPLEFAQAAPVGIEDLGLAVLRHRLLQRLAAETGVHGVGKTPCKHVTARPVHDRDQVKTRAAPRCK